MQRTLSPSKNRHLCIRQPWLCAIGHTFSSLSMRRSFGLISGQRQAIGASLLASREFKPGLLCSVTRSRGCGLAAGSFGLRSFTHTEDTEKHGKRTHKGYGYHRNNGNNRSLFEKGYGLQTRTHNSLKSYVTTKNANHRISGAGLESTPPALFTLRYGAYKGDVR